MYRRHKADPPDSALLAHDLANNPAHAAVMPTLDAARSRIAAVRPDAYARSRNAIDGAVSGLSPYITHGFVSLQEVLEGVNARHALDVQHKFVYELGWREFFRHVWQNMGISIFSSLHDGPMPEPAYVRELPADIRQGRSGVPVIDMAVRQLYATGTLHNHARMWLASYVVHLRKVHWRCAADWLYAHLLDGDLASNHLSWQWVAGTGSSKPYLFNADNVARYAPLAWHSHGSIIDTSYEVLDGIARNPAIHLADAGDNNSLPAGVTEPPMLSAPPNWIGATPPEVSAVAAREVWLIHPWNLSALPAELPPDTVVIAIFVADFHSAWPWSDGRWRFVGTRMAELTPIRWYGSAAAIGQALSHASRVRSVAEPHLMPWLRQWAECAPAPMLFPAVDRPCNSFSQWWTRASRSLQSATQLLAPDKVTRHDDSETRL